MKQSAITPDPQYYSRYINHVPDLDLSDALEQSLQTLLALDPAKLEPLGNYAYAPGKWTLKNVFQHITDTERVFTYRTLLFARNDQTTPAPFDQDEYAGNTFLDERSLKDVLDELIAVRISTIALFKSFSDKILLKTGKNWKYEMSVLAMGFTIAGHQIHHLNIINDKYLNGGH
ncbi:MAG TPA: DinB family protein [Chitinophaga sp.]|uniref:DinB family protein n=1 Tax=Chitinophaga sp. TaxID=1869181 RepID=UPI002CC4D872|nr:DinB family protein [Chitinophaga sp.]HVI48097.1 DinB family protein [Chitinophaga sp.]